MHYYIDGYNLIFRLMGAADEDLRSQRHHIILDLSRKIQLLGLDATLVFDSQYQQGESTRSYYNHLEILFTAAGETADDCILQELQASPNVRQETVVTSDKGLAWRVRRKHARSESVEEFVAWLNQRVKKKIKLKKKAKEGPRTGSTHSVLRKISSDKKSTGGPVPEASPEECFDYYLAIFEQQYVESVPETSASGDPAVKLSGLSTKRKSKKPKKAEGEPGVSDFERWLKAFEERLSTETH